MAHDTFFLNGRPQPATFKWVNMGKAGLWESPSASWDATGILDAFAQADEREGGRHHSFFRRQGLFEAKFLSVSSVSPSGVKADNLLSNQMPDLSLSLL